jgi:hypothetical protein
MCHDGIMKPKNYQGPEGFVIPILDFGDDDEDFEEM